MVLGFVLLGVFLSETSGFWWLVCAVFSWIISAMLIELKIKNIEKKKNNRWKQ